MTTNWRECALNYVEVGRCLATIEDAMRDIHCQLAADHNTVAITLAEAITASRRLTKALETIKITAEAEKQEQNDREAAIPRRGAPE